MSAQTAVIASEPPASDAGGRPRASAGSPKGTSALKFTVAEYFALERASEIRYEYVEGELIPMPGVSLPHNRISLNFSMAFDRGFDSQPGEVFIEAVRVRVSPTQYRYPDVVAIAGRPQTDGENPPALLNPHVLVEVLSASTEAKDRREKFNEYRQMPSLTDYVLAAQDRPAVTHYARQSPKQWTITDYTELTDTLTFAALGATLSLAEVYRKVEFPAPPAASAKTRGRKSGGK